MKSLIWTTEKRKVKDLIPYELNPRKITEEQAKKLTESLKRFNLVEIPAIDTDNKILAGHQRVATLLILGRGNEEIDVRLPNRRLTKEEFEKYNLISNRVTGEWNYEILKDFNIETLLETGFDDSDLSYIFDQSLGVEDDEFETSKEIIKIKNPKTKTGDLIIFEDGVLCCGDGTDPEVVNKLTRNNKINLINIDPPYNIGLDYNNGFRTRGKYGGTTLDNKSDTEYREFLKNLLQNSLDHTYPNFHCFLWADERYIGMIQSLYSELGIDNKRVCLWIKNSQNPTPQIAFSKCYEACVYGVVGKPYLSPSVHNSNEVMNKEIGTGNRLPDDIMDTFNIWLVKRLNTQDYSHPTEKPASLYEKALRRCSKPGDTILDLTAGSGALMSACIQLRRRFLLCEIEPIFCDLIVERYRRLTGKEPKYVNP